MKSKKLINNIKSKHILDSILNYIKDKNFKDKLFLYSKELQIKFDIKLIGLKENYLKKLNFDIDKYLHIEPNLFKKDILTKKYNQFLKEKKIYKEELENIIYDIFEDKEMKDIEEEDIDKIKDNEKLINIESPLFKMLSKTKNFEKIFTIYISQNNIDQYKLKDEYIKFFDKLNNLNIKYSSIFYNLKDINKIVYLKEININFNKIKRLTIINDDEDENEEEEEEEEDDIIKRQIKSFFKILFSINRIENNLIYLKIILKNCEINNELFENINNFRLLRYLYLENINFEKDFLIKLNLLKLISIISCNNIKLSEISNEKLNKLKINKNKISDIKILEKVNIKELKELDLSYNEISDINILEKINFNKLNKLNLSNNKISDIKILEKVNFNELKELNLSNNKISDIKILGKVNFNVLKELNLSNNKISDIKILDKVNFKELKG